MVGPFDVIKTRLMAQGKEGSGGGGGGPRYSGMLDALVKIPQQEGVRALYKGLLPRLMRIPPGQVGASPGPSVMYVLGVVSSWVCTWMANGSRGLPVRTPSLATPHHPAPQTHNHKCTHTHNRRRSCGRSATRSRATSNATAGAD